MHLFIIPARSRDPVSFWYLLWCVCFTQILFIVVLHALTIICNGSRAFVCPTSPAFCIFLAPMSLTALGCASAPPVVCRQSVLLIRSYRGGGRTMLMRRAQFEVYAENAHNGFQLCACCCCSQPVDSLVASFRSRYARDIYTLTIKIEADFMQMYIRE